VTDGTVNVMLCVADRFRCDRINKQPTVPTQTCHQQATSSVHYTANCKHSLVLLRMGEIIARNMLSWLKLLIRFVIVASSWLFILLYHWCTVTQTSNVFLSHLRSHPLLHIMFAFQWQSINLSVVWTYFSYASYHLIIVYKNTEVNVLHSYKILLCYQQ